MIIKKLMNNVFKLDDMRELNEILDVDHVYDSEQYLFCGDTINDIIDELEYLGFCFEDLLRNTTNDKLLGYSSWELFYIEKEKKYYLIDNYI